VEESAMKKTRFRSVVASLKDMAGDEYVDAVCAAQAVLSGESKGALQRIASENVDFFSGSFQQRLLELLPQVGNKVGRSVKGSASGATTARFAENTRVERSPLTGLGHFRVGEDGRLYLILKSEHYHVPLGHSFPGYRLIENARRLGIPNATHNNTRGHITRLLEEELVRMAAGLHRSDRLGLRRILETRRSGVLNRVLNLETGSLAVEAAIKMILARFYQVQEDAPAPKYRGRVPVFLVVGDDDGDLVGNYHGTTVIAQSMRGMWTEFLAGMEKQGLLMVRAVRPNDKEGLEAVFRRYDRKPHKIAGFFHEIIMMNYGARRLTKAFLRRAYALCRKHDVPTVADEIQSCLWAPELFLFREYGLRPTFVALGKGFPGGEYPASRILFNVQMDSLPQFGALVTNGQEELASLAYLVTMRWAEANASVTKSIGEYYEGRLRDLAKRYRSVMSGVEGCRHLSAVCFHDLKSAKSFAASLNGRGLDISVQTYKATCPPSALTKLPLIAGYEVVDYVTKLMEDALRDLGA
jgi:acetylornithine/succinyldiaminopimelate/putrescine aminotransferase